MSPIPNESLAAIAAKTVTTKEAERNALEAEDLIQPAKTQDEREYWQRVADAWWAKA